MASALTCKFNRRPSQWMNTWARSRSFEHQIEDGFMSGKGGRW